MERFDLNKPCYTEIIFEAILILMLCFVVYGAIYLFFI